VLGQEFGKVIPLDAEVTAGKPEGRQLPVSNPSQHGRIAYSATLGNKTDRDEFRSPLLKYLMQNNLLTIEVLMA
jgi:hypothetical protein